MRWLEKTYSKTLEKFRSELKERHSLKEEEIGICLELATLDLADPNLYQNLSTGAN